MLWPTWGHWDCGTDVGLHEEIHDQGIYKSIG